MYHYGRTETCLVREHAALEALSHGEDHGADAASHERLRTERVNKYRLERGKNHIKVHTDDHNAAENKKDNHKGNDLLGNSGDALNSAESDDCNENHYDNADKDVVKGCSRNADSRKRLNIKCSRNICNDLVDLSHASDTEGSKHGEYTEENSENFT